MAAGRDTVAVCRPGFGHQQHSLTIHEAGQYLEIAFLQARWVGKATHHSTLSKPAILRAVPLNSAPRVVKTRMARHKQVASNTARQAVSLVPTMHQIHKATPDTSKSEIEI